MTCQHWVSVVCQDFLTDDAEFNYHNTHFARDLISISELRKPRLILEGWPSPWLWVRLFHGLSVLLPPCFSTMRVPLPWPELLPEALDIRISTYKLGWRVVQTFRPQHGLIVYSRNVIEILLCPGNRVRAARSDKGYLRLSMTLLSNKVENIGNI